MGSEMCIRDRAGIGDKIEEMFVEEIAGKGAVRNTLKKYL